LLARGVEGLRGLFRDGFGSILSVRKGGVVSFFSEESDTSYCCAESGCSSSEEGFVGRVLLGSDETFDVFRLRKCLNVLLLVLVLRLGDFSRSLSGVAEWGRDRGRSGTIVLCYDSGLLVVNGCGRGRRSGLFRYDGGSVSLVLLGNLCVDEAVRRDGRDRFLSTSVGDRRRGRRGILRLLATRNEGRGRGREASSWSDGTSFLGGDFLVVRRSGCSNYGSDSSSDDGGSSSSDSSSWKR
jgi:hypothetical protein